MVIRLFLCMLAFTLFFVSIEAGDVKVESNIDQIKVWENQPIKGLITITHDVSDKVDTSSFKLGSAPLKVDFVEDVRVSSQSPLTVSYYKFTVPPQPKGLQLLPAVSVKVGDDVYQSIESTYEVGDLGSAPPPGKKVLKLNAIVDGPTTIYPGMRFKVIYQYIFNDNIELKQEKLPLLEGKGFQKVGASDVVDKEDSNVSTREITQMFEAVKPGEYNFEGSLIEGYVYRNDPFGSRIYLQPMLRSETLPVKITVLPFPKEGQPASFNGAIGPFSAFSSSLSSSPTVSVGDKMVLAVELAGTGQLANAHLPDLCCQPGWSGVFQLSDLPPQEEVKGSVKYFTVEMRPLIANVKEIASIQFSYFLPDSKTYGTLKSKPIAVNINQLPQNKENENQEAAQKPVQPIKETATSPLPSPIEIQTIQPLAPSDLSNLLFGHWWVLWMIPLGAAAILGQIYLKRYLSQRPHEEKKKTSTDILKEALSSDRKSAAFYHLLGQALMTRLIEKGKIPAATATVENLPDEGIAGNVKQFLQQIEEKRFTGQDKQLDREVISNAKKLFNQI